MYTYLYEQTHVQVLWSVVWTNIELDDEMSGSESDSEFEVRDHTKKVKVLSCHHLSVTVRILPI